MLTQKFGLICKKLITIFGKALKVVQEIIIAILCKSPNWNFKKLRDFHTSYYKFKEKEILDKYHNQRTCASAGEGFFNKGLEELRAALEMLFSTTLFATHPFWKRKLTQHEEILWKYFCSVIYIQEFYSFQFF